MGYVANMSLLALSLKATAFSAVAEAELWIWKY